VTTNHPSITVQRIIQSAQASVDFALTCLEPVGHNLRLRSSFMDPAAKPMHWHDFGDLEGPGWAANAIGGATLLFRWGVFCQDLDLQSTALRLTDHILEDGFIQSDGFVYPYYDLARSRFCLNYTHQDDWLCPGSLARIGVQMIEFAIELKQNGVEDHRPNRLVQAAHNLSQWLAANVPLLKNDWTPRRISRTGEEYPLNPHGLLDSIYDHSADGLYLLQLWALTKKVKLASRLGDSFTTHGGFWGSINHDTFDDHENVAYATAFRILRQCGKLLDKPDWIDFAYRFSLPGMLPFRMEQNQHGVATRGLFYMEESWDTAYLWENAEVAQAYLEAWQETGDSSFKEIALAVLEAIARHHYGSLGFLSEGIDWNNHVHQRHHIHFDYYGAIRYTEPLLNNIHHLLPTLTYLSTLPSDSFSRQDIGSPKGLLSPGDHGEKEKKLRYLIRFYHAAIETDDGVKAAINFCRRAGIDAVLLFEASYDGDFAMLTLNLLKQRFDRLKRIVPEFRAIGLEVHINIMITMGHVDAGGGQPECLGFQMLVDENGKTSRSTVCPLDPGFLEYASQLYRWAAECDADVVWMDDDLRLLFHDLSGSACFCPHHLQAFSQLVPPPFGDEWDRKSLVSALTDSEADDKIQWRWLDLQESSIRKLAIMAEIAVHVVDPDQKIGLMTVGTAIHHAEGRHMDQLLRVIAGNQHAPLLRPGSGFWHDQEPAAVLYKTEDVYRQAGFLGNDVGLVAEIENHPYSRYLKSFSILELEMVLNVLAGTDDLSLNLFSSLNPFSKAAENEDLINFLRELRPFLNELMQVRGDKIRNGIGIEASEDIARFIHPENADFKAWIEPRPWEILLQRLGLPVGRAQSVPHLLTGDLVYTIDPAAMEMMLQDGAVLTPFAVRGLIKRGWGERIGVLSVEPAAPGVNEMFTEHPLNGKWMNWKLPVRHYRDSVNPHVYELMPENKIHCVSRWQDIHGQDCGAAVVTIELINSGRIALLPYELPGISLVLLHESRRTQWGALFEWVSGQPLSCKVKNGYNIIPQVFTSRRDDGLLLAVINLSADDQTGHLAGPLFDNRSFKRLLKDGTWIQEETPDCLILPAWSIAVLADS